MFAGHRLATALGVVGPIAVTGNDELSRKQLIRAGEAMVNAGLAIILSEAGSKKPLCILTATERKQADQAAIDAAAAAGDPRAHSRTHRCGPAHVITDPKDATRILTRVSKRQRFNLGVEPRRSRVVIVDVDTASQYKGFALRCGKDRPGLTVRSPGSQDPSGAWVHKDGGHIWFEVPDDLELPTSVGSHHDEDAGWTAFWGEGHILVPPSVRREGPYVLVGSTHPLPDWLRDTILRAGANHQVRKEKSRRSNARLAARGEVSGIDVWSVHTPASDILTPNGWTETNEPDSCGCPTWTAPGPHGSSKSATAHGPGCSIYACVTGHGPIRVWTDNPGEAIAKAVAAHGKTLTKIQAYAWINTAGDIGRACKELGITYPAPTVISRPLTTWDEVDAQEPTLEHTPKPSDVPSDGDGYDLVDPVIDPPSVDEINDLSPRKMGEEISWREQQVRLLLERREIDDEVTRRYDEIRTPPLQKWEFETFLNAPRPEVLVNDMLYKDSLSRMYGAPGCGKSYLALDLSLTLATGRFWKGTKLPRTKVVYVMAEGQRVNGDRTAAWMSKHNKAVDDLAGWFHAVPEAVKLTPAGVSQLADWVHELGAGLVVLDTKNAMMAGEENSATDTAVMREALDRIRTASGACVLLVDHTGYEGTRARGSSAATAAMDTEIRVVKDDTERPSLITAEITRDKAGESGAKWAWRLLPEHPAAVLDSTTVPVTSEDGSDWLKSRQTLPEPVESYTGEGKTAVTDLARLMIFQTIPQHDRSQIGMTLSDAKRELKERLDYNGKTVTRAWSWLKAEEYLVSTFDEPTETQNRTGPHVWKGPSGLSGTSAAVGGT
jgi:hypothetical protein